MYAITGKLLSVDLGRGTCSAEELPPAKYREYLGGYGLGAALLLERMDPACDPLGPKNILGFAAGYLLGRDPHQAVPGHRRQDAARLGRQQLLAPEREEVRRADLVDVLVLGRVEVKRLGEAAGLGLGARLERAGVVPPGLDVAGAVGRGPVVAAH